MRTAAKQFIERHVAHAFVYKFLIFKNIISQNATAEAEHDLREHRADFSRPDYSHRFSMQIETCQPFQ